MSRRREDMLKFKINPKSKGQISKHKFCHLEFVICYYFLICALSLGFLMSGCGTAKECAKGIAGLSTKVLEDTRKDAIVKVFNYDYNTCYKKTEEILKRTGSYIYARDTKKDLIAVYVSQTDTTPVGLFFSQIDASNTRIEVSSPSTYGKEFISNVVFSSLEKSLHPEKEVKQAGLEKQISKE